MRKFDLERLKGKVAVTCTTKEDTRDFLYYLDSVGITRNNNMSII